MISISAETRVEMSHPHVPVREEAGLHLSPYRLVRKIGQGGMGSVYLAEDLTSKRPCAVKIIRSDKASDALCVARFQFEIEVLSRFSHPAIVGLIDTAFTGASSRYFAMEYIAGENLDEKVRRDGPLAPNHVVEVLRRICSALGEIHADGIIHHDIKPANIMEIGQGRRCEGVKLIDFGIARSVRAKCSRSGRLKEGAFAGSPLFAPPESYSGAIDLRGDIYSLGATAYYLLTGRPVFDEARPLAAIRAHMVCAPVPIHRLRRTVDPILDSIIMKCLNKNPAHRYQTAEEFDAALAGYRTDGIVPSRIACGAEHHQPYPEAAPIQMACCG
ncbi:MAG: serine/threonine protein kinase [Pirellulaceae bacterium]